ncbi:MAG: lipoate--protein ligase family protein [Candidatus Thorarchaeota archaeon]|nr:lipoate--protein ligase family protein [Candidatus Thorarchaeota archaeon]
MTWRLIHENSTDIYRNLAVDEAVARSKADQEGVSNSLRFWRAKRAVVIGRFQCVHKEVDLAYCKENKIGIARRFTGGGSVYHDLGNLNFSICVGRDEDYVPRTLKEIYDLFIGNISAALQSLGVPTRYDPVRSCIRISDLKITGTAGWLKRGTAFLHGTLLVKANLEMLAQSLAPPAHQPVFLRDRTRVRCMDSKRDYVTNISDQVDDCPSKDEIKNAIVQSLEKISNQRFHSGVLTKEEKDTAEALYQSRYSQTEWNLGTPAQRDRGITK